MTPFERAHRFLGIAELDGTRHHPLIQWWLMLAGMGDDSPDEIPWCAAFVTGVAWDLRLPIPKVSSRARQWLTVGEEIDLAFAQLGDVVVLSRGSNPAQGHVGFFAGWQQLPGATPGPSKVLLLGGNQHDAVTIEPFPQSRVVGVRRIV